MKPTLICTACFMIFSLTLSAQTKKAKKQQPKKIEIKKQAADVTTDTGGIKLSNNTIVTNSNASLIQKPLETVDYSTSAYYLIKSKND